MATHAQVRKIAMALPGVSASATELAFSVEHKGKAKGFLWTWKERVEPKKPRIPNPGVIAVRVPNLAQKDLIIASDPAKFFTEPHYNGFPAVLVRLKAVTVADLKVLIPEAWRCLAPKELVAATESPPPRGRRGRQAPEAAKGAVPRRTRGRAPVRGTPSASSRAPRKDR